MKRKNSKKQAALNADWDVDHRNPYSLLVRMRNGGASLKEMWWCLSKLKGHLTIEFHNCPTYIYLKALKTVSRDWREGLTTKNRYCLSGGAKIQLQEDLIPSSDLFRYYRLMHKPVCTHVHTHPFIHTHILIITTKSFEKLASKQNIFMGMFIAAFFIISQS